MGARPFGLYRATRRRGVIVAAVVAIAYVVLYPRGSSKPATV
jgi:hypothetical protein